MANLEPLMRQNFLDYASYVIVERAMPDLRDEYYTKCGSACDAVADAKKAKEW